MSRLVLAFLAVLALAGCATSEISLHEQIVLVNEAITSSALAAAAALDAGYISVKEACVVHEYSRLASVIVDQAWAALFQGDHDNVEFYIQKAREAMIGLSEEAQKRADYHCAGS